MRVLSLLLCLLALTALPSSLANFYVQGDGPADDPVPYAPQMTCAFYFDVPGSEQRCEVYDNVVDAGVLTIRSNGRADVHAIVFVNSFAVRGLWCPKPQVFCDVSLPNGPYTGPMELFTRVSNADVHAIATSDVSTGTALPV